MFGDPSVVFLDAMWSVATNTCGRVAIFLV